MARIYLIWIELDLRLMGFLTLVSVMLAILGLALFVRQRRWHEYVTAFVALFLLMIVVSVLFCNYLFDYPVFTIPKFQASH